VVLRVFHLRIQNIVAVKLWKVPEQQRQQAGRRECPGHKSPAGAVCVEYISPCVVNQPAQHDYQWPTMSAHTVVCWTVQALAT
jgi:hypothetical protein